jgi:hypothetical protein
MADSAVVWMACVPFWRKRLDGYRQMFNVMHGESHADAILLIVYGDCRLQQDADSQLSRR